MQSTDTHGGGATGASPPATRPFGVYTFGPFELDPRSKRLLRDRTEVPLTGRQFEILRALVTSAGDVLPKHRLMETVWQDVAVGDNSLEQLISQLREKLDDRDPHQYIDTVPRRGYRFAAPVSPVDLRLTDADLDGLIAPYRTYVDGRAALETLERSEIARARSTFARVLLRHGNDAACHIGLANACVLEFESTRADPAPDTDALRLAVTHAREACRLNPDSGEPWATLGFVFERTGARLDALAALMRAVMLEPGNWRHQLRLSSASWGQDRLSAAHRTLALRPDCPLAHWLAATVFVAREALAKAEREVDAGLAAPAGESITPARFSAVALHWLKGLLCLARGDDEEAIASFERELASEARGHIYARECCANTWYAIGACRLRQGDRAAARAAFEQATARVPRHAMAHVGLALLGTVTPADDVMAVTPASIDHAIARAAWLVAHDDAPGAARLVMSALASSLPGPPGPPGPSDNAGWLVPIEPLLGIQRAPGARAAWAPVLAALGTRAS